MLCLYSEVTDLKWQSDPHSIFEKSSYFLMTFPALLAISIPHPPPQHTQTLVSHLPGQHQVPNKVTVPGNHPPLICEQGHKEMLLNSQQALLSYSNPSKINQTYPTCNFCRKSTQPQHWGCLQHPQFWTCPVQKFLVAPHC